VAAQRRDAHGDHPDERPAHPLDHPHDHAHDHPHDHTHGPEHDDPRGGASHDAAPGHDGFRVAPGPVPAPAAADHLRAVVELLIEKGVIAADEIRRKRHDLRLRGPRLGARVVARAWTDPDFRAALLDDAVVAVRRMGIEPLTPTSGRLVALENSAAVHHVVVCTLCSCYPNALLGPAPAWYSSEEYRRRVVSEPRVVLSEFGLQLPSGMEVRVVDSTAECRYLVVPRRPPGSDGLDEDELADLVTPESMVGTAEALPVVG